MEKKKCSTYLEEELFGVRRHRDHLGNGERKVHPALVFLLFDVVFSHFPVVLRGITFCLRGIAAQADNDGVRRASNILPGINMN